MLLFHFNTNTRTHVISQKSSELMIKVLGLEVCTLAGWWQKEGNRQTLVKRSKGHSSYCPSCGSRNPPRTVIARSSYHRGHKSPQRALRARR